MITISLRMDKKRVAALLLALGLIGAGAAGIREKLVQQVMQSSSISARKVNPAAATEQQRRSPASLTRPTKSTTTSRSSRAST